METLLIKYGKYEQSMTVSRGTVVVNFLRFKDKNKNKHVFTAEDKDFLKDNNYKCVTILITGHSLLQLTERTVTTVRQLITTTGCLRLWSSNVAMCDVSQTHTRLSNWSFCPSHCSQLLVHVYVTTYLFIYATLHLPFWSLPVAEGTLFCWKLQCHLQEIETHLIQCALGPQEYTQTGHWSVPV